MPKKFPRSEEYVRISVTLTKEQHIKLKALAAHNNRSATRQATHLLTPVLS
jgi:hypothetical protein